MDQREETEQMQHMEQSGSVPGGPHPFEATFLSDEAFEFSRFAMEIRQTLCRFRLRLKWPVRISLAMPRSLAVASCFLNAILQLWQDSQRPKSPL